MELRKLCLHPFLCNGLEDDLLEKAALQQLQAPPQGQVGQGRQPDPRSQGTLEYIGMQSGLYSCQECEEVYRSTVLTVCPATAV